MTPDNYQQLLDETLEQISAGASQVAILGVTPTAFKLSAALRDLGLSQCVVGIFGATEEVFPPGTMPYESLKSASIDLVIVGADSEKETILRAAMHFIKGTPRVILSGYGHLNFNSSVLSNELANLLVPSLANGYPNTTIHLYQCLANAARLGLKGVVAEFGMFKGGTTMLLSRVIERLGASWEVFGFDSFSGFPARRSMLDMYDHPGCVFRDVAAVKAYFAGRRVHVISGDIVETARLLEDKDLVLTFIDTDNYTSANAAIEVARERTVLHGTIVFDHFTGVDRFKYTLGERMAAAALLDDRRYFNLHGTGVFIRQA